MAGGFQRISHRVERSGGRLRAQTIGECGRLGWPSEDEIYRGLGGKQILLDGDQRPSCLWARWAKRSPDNAWGLSSKEKEGEKRKSS